MSVRIGLPWMARHTFDGVSGMSAWRTPYGFERVHHGVDDGGRRADRRRLAHALRADRVVRRRRDRLAQLPRSGTPSTVGSR